MNNSMRIFAGTVPTIGNAPCKIAVFENGKVFEKVYFDDFNFYGNENWVRNACLEKYKTIESITKKIISMGFKEM